MTQVGHMLLNSAHVAPHVRFDLLGTVRILERVDCSRSAGLLVSLNRLF